MAFERDGAFIVTPEWLHKHATRKGAGWTYEALKVLGVPWPLTKGWLTGLSGLRISNEERHEFERICAKRRAKVARNQGLPL